MAPMRSMRASGLGLVLPIIVTVASLASATALAQQAPPAVTPPAESPPAASPEAPVEPIEPPTPGPETPPAGTPEAAAPAPVPPPAPPPTTLTEPMPAAPAASAIPPPKEPFYHKAWFWGAVSLVVLTGVFIAVVSATSSPTPVPHTTFGDMRAF